MISRSVQAKLTLVMATALILVGASTFFSVWWFTDQAIEKRQKDLEHQIRETLKRKGEVLAASHSMALRPLVVDNAFGDVRKLVEGTVAQDSDVLYGLFLSAEGAAWSYASPNHPPDKGDDLVADPKAFEELKLSEARFGGQERELFGQSVIEFSHRVVWDEEHLGTVYYGMTVSSLRDALELSRAEATASKRQLLQAIAVLCVGILALSLLLMARAARAITQPLKQLTEAAHDIAQGDRSRRVKVASRDEIQLLARAFNEMLEENEKQFVELEKTTEQALEASRLKSEFLANMSHEIRTPMNGVLGMIKLVLRQPLDAKARRYADTVQASAHALMTIVNDILDFSKMEADKYTLQSVGFDARTVIQEVAELLSTRAQESNVELIYRIQPGFPARLMGDPDRFRQVLNNLVGNAVKFTDHGEIFIDTNYEMVAENRVRCTLDVLDSGVGIPAESLEGLFDAFAQADGSMRRKHGGTGLGLTISRRLAQMMNGDITVESTVGVGSKFTVTMEFGIGEQHEAVPRWDWTTGKNIAVFEPSPRWSGVIEEHLGRWGMESSFFKTRTAVLDALKRESAPPFDALIIGLRVEDQSVDEFIRAVRAVKGCGELPIVVLTQLGTSATLSEVAKEIAAQVQKPLRLSELFNALQGTIGGGSESQLPMPERRERVRVMSDKAILVVDDNEVNRLIAEEELNLVGFRTETACDGQEALDKVKEKEYLLVLMDCQMPVMDGYTATAEIRKHEEGTGRRTLIIALTAHAMGGERERVLAAGMDDYMSKPFRPESLRRLLRQHGVGVRAEPNKPTPAPEPTRVSVPAPPLSDRGAENDVTPPPAEKATGAKGKPARPGSVSKSPRSEAVELTPGVRRSARLIALFLKNIPVQIEELEQAWEAGDAGQTRAHSHKLKGSCLAVDARPMAKAAESIQRLAETGDLERVEPLIREIHERFPRVKALLEEEAKSA